MSTINFTAEIVLFIPKIAFFNELHPEPDHIKPHQVWHDALASA